MKKDKTFSMSRDGIVYIQVQLNDELNNKDEFWSKFKHGVSTFKAQLPKNVLAVQVPFPLPCCPELLPLQYPDGL